MEGHDPSLIDLTSFEWDMEPHVKREKTEDMEEMELEVEVKGVIKSEREMVHEDQGSQVTSSEAHTFVDVDDTEETKKCGVCGRVARCNHFGAVCCDSCKAFFRRSVQSQVFDTFFCVKDGRCNVYQNRKSCQACRFKRCQNIGMDTSLVMNEDERRALMNRKLERRRKMAIEHQRRGTKRHQKNRSDHQHISTPQEIMDLTDSALSRGERGDNYWNMEFLSAEDKGKIMHLRKILVQSLSFPEFPQHYHEKNADILEHMFFVFCKSMGKFFSSTLEIRELQMNDQKILLKPAVAKAAFIFGTHQYDSDKELWPRRSFTSSCTFPKISLQAVDRFVDDDTTMMKWRLFFKKYYYLYSDEIFMILTLMVSLFDHDDPNIVGTLEIASRKTKYIHLIERYMQQYQDSISITNVMSHLLESMADLQELRECFQRTSSEENEASNVKSDESFKFSSSLGDAVNLPPKKALHKRTTSLYRENTIITLDEGDDLDITNEQKPFYQCEPLSYPSQHEYGFNKVGQTSSMNTRNSPKPNPNHRISSQELIWPEDILTPLKIEIPLSDSQNTTPNDEYKGKPSPEHPKNITLSLDENNGVQKEPLLMLSKGTKREYTDIQKSKDDEELLKVLQKSLPPHLAELWAKKICMSIK